MGNVNAFIQRLTELIGINREHGVDCAGLPNQQRGLRVRSSRAGSALTISAARAFSLDIGRNFDIDPGQVLDERVLQAAPDRRYFVPLAPGKL